MTKPITITVGVLALQGGVVEHLNLLRKAASHVQSSPPESTADNLQFTFTEVRTAPQLAQCDALIIPGGESTTMAIVARRLGLLDPLREFVKVQHKPVWGTCAGLVMLAEQAAATKQGGQELIGGLGVKVLRNRYGTQMQSFVAGLDLGFLGPGQEPFRAVFIRAPVVEAVIGEDGAAGSGVEGGKGAPVEVLGVYYRGEGQQQQEAGTGKGDIVAVRQGNVFGTSFHPELTDDVRIHVWWLRQVVDSLRHGKLVVNGA
ncbi:class I glutamine amidotransferase-like protein [Parachaetomium inaequale]|uniref:glutaminase n=1 Tax=Parachaetomium inaequale TaxID=2588326 RepID=A0AAN6PIP4_9PEZI|nr:class I glutamine amidotransferase-like protein [Parachaetomium inaequale]